MGIGKPTTPCKVITVKQHKLPGVHEEIEETIEELYQVGIILLAHNAFNSLI